MKYQILDWSFYQTSKMFSDIFKMIKDDSMIAQLYKEYIMTTVLQKYLFLIN